MKSQKLMLILKYSASSLPIFKQKAISGNYPIVFLKNISDPSQQIGSEGRELEKINKRVLFAI